LATLQLEIIEPDTVAVDWVVRHVRQDDVFSRTRNREYKHVLSHAYLFVEGVLNQRLDAWLLFRQGECEVVVDLAAVDAVWEAEIGQHFNLLCGKESGREGCFDWREWEWIQDLRLHPVARDFVCAYYDVLFEEMLLRQFNHSQQLLKPRQVLLLLVRFK
jgi:hypothetical protein